MVELLGGTGVPRDVARQLVGSHVTKPCSEPWMDQVRHARKCAMWHIVKLVSANLFVQRHFVDLSVWKNGIGAEIADVRNSAGLSTG